VLGHQLNSVIQVCDFQHTESAQLFLSLRIRATR
jgi:hypothetical protein